MLVVVKAAC